MEISNNTCEWRASPVFPNEYLVSSTGYVYSKRTDRILRPNRDKNGYEYYVLCVAGCRRTVKAHRLVAMAFISNPARLPTVDHINGDKTDNHVSNLRWASNYQQTHNPVTFVKLQNAHARTDYREMGARRNFGRKPVVVYDGDTITQYPSLKSAAQACRVSEGKLSEMLNGKRSLKGINAAWSSEIKPFCIAVTKRHFGEE